MKKRKAKIKQREKIKPDYLFITSHQLRTPLSAIKWVLEILLKGQAGRLTRKQRELIFSVYKANERTIVLVNDLLKVAMLEEGKIFLNYQKVDLYSIINDVLWELKPQQKSKQITIEFHKVKNLKPLVPVDPLQFHQALANIISNAIKYSPTKSKVTLTVKKDQKQIIFACRDQGLGIAKDEQSRIFTKFFRSSKIEKQKIPGSGLGLYIAQKIIKAHHGKIWFVSQKNKGTTFFISLPLVR